MAQKTELTYPTPTEWKAKVRDELKSRGRGAQAALAKYLHCSTGTLADLLGEKGKQSHLVARIHKYFGWPAPMAPLASADAGELAFIWEHLGDVDRARLLERARTMWELKKKS